MLDAAHAWRAVSAQSQGTSRPAASPAYIPVYATDIIRTGPGLPDHPHRQRRPAPLLAGSAPGLAGRLRPRRPERPGILQAPRRLLPDLHRLADHGEIEIDNNLIENGIRPTAVGKRNWLFVGGKAPAGAPRSSTPWSSAPNATATTPRSGWPTCSNACRR